MNELNRSRMNAPVDPGFHNVKFLLYYGDLTLGYLYGQVPDAGDTPLCDPLIRVIILPGFNVNWENDDDDTGRDAGDGNP